MSLQHGKILFTYHSSNLTKHSFVPWVETRFEMNHCFCYGNLSSMHYIQRFLPLRKAFLNQFLFMSGTIALPFDMTLQKEDTPAMNKANLRGLKALTGLLILLKSYPNHRFFRPMCHWGWAMTWNKNNQELFKGPPKFKHLTRTEKVVIPRLWIGHAKAAKSHILSRGPPTTCHHCGQALTIDHISQSQGENCGNRSFDIPKWP